jgi:uncharacterized protein (DUF342 family)
MGDSSQELLQTNKLFERSGIVIETDRTEMICYFSYRNTTAMPKLSKTVVKAALKKAGVVYGVLEDEVEKLDGEIEDVTNLVIAKGLAPVLDSEPKLKYLFNTNPYKQKIDNKLGADKDSLDHKKRDPIPYVKEGDILAELVTDTEPEPGMTILGTEIEADLAQQALEQGDIDSGKNVKFTGGKMIANDEGAPKLDEMGRVEIVPEWIIRGDVAIRTGNIIFPGVVRIGGEIQAGFEVHAGSIYAGSVENLAVVEAENDITIDGGIQESRIRCGGKLEARFINNADVTAGGDIQVHLSVVNSIVRTSGHLDAQTVFGGTVIARKGIEVMNLSSEANRTTVLFGIDPIKQSDLGEIVEQKLEIETKVQLIKDKMGEDLDIYEFVLKSKDEIEPLLAEKTALKERMDALDPDDEASLEFFNLRLEEIAGIVDPIEVQLVDSVKRMAKIESKWKNQLADLKLLNMQLAELEAKQAEGEQDDDMEGTVPKVIVKGKVLQGTRISGPKARVVLTREFQRILFQQRKVTTDAEKAKYGNRLEYFMHIDRV